MMANKLLTSTVLLLLVCKIVANSDEEYVDSVINLLLNGESLEVVQSEEEGEGKEPVLTRGTIWKCGNCAGVDDSMLVYSEVNELDEDFDDQPVDVQISLSIPTMQCISVVGDRAGIVRLVGGACAGPHVTLDLSAATRFTVNVYANRTGIEPLQ